MIGRHCILALEPNPDSRTDSASPVCAATAGRAGIAARLPQGHAAALIAATADIVWWADAARRIGGVRGWTAFTGQQAETAAGSGWLDAVHPDDRDRVYSESPVAGEASVREYRLHHAASGEWRWVVDRATRLIDDRGNLGAWVGCIADIHARKTAELALQAREEHLRLAVESSGVGTWEVDLLDGTRTWSDQLKLMMGIGPAVTATQEMLFERVHPADRERVREANLAWATNGAVTSEIVFRIIRKDTAAIRWIASSGRACFDAEGRPIRRLGMWQDITDRRLAEDKIWAAANLDPLTALANRTLFQSRLKQAVRDAEGSQCAVGLLIVDLDHFKEINDTLGHEAGDRVLHLVAGRITECVPPGGSVARLGGDEFAVLLPDVGGVDLGALSQVIVEAVAVPIRYDSLTLDFSVSIGSSVFPADDTTGAELLKNADLALYAAKREGRNRYAVFKPAMKAAIERRVGILRSVRNALDSDAFVPFYQPKVSFDTDRVVGFEALLRWRSPTGLLPPAAVQDAFEDPELAVRIGDRMLSKVIADIGRWRSRDIVFGRIALNVSNAEFANVDVAARTLSSLQRASLPPDVLEIEVVESVLFHGESGRTLEVMHRLRQHGIMLSLDDFGTGYASLSHLQRYPVRWLKIDRSFIRDLPEGGTAAAIVRSIVGLAHDLGLRVVAEGVETLVQARALSDIGCDAAQGYLIAKPMAASRVPFFLANWAGFTDLRGTRDARRATSSRPS